jgi:hypothetical protein
MFIDTGTLIATVIALISQFILLVVMFRSAYKWEQAYHSVVRKLKIERAARDYSVRNS